MRQPDDEWPLPRAAGRAAERVSRSLDGSRGLSAGELLPLVYDELRGLARAHVSRLAPGQTLQATALVHEAWMRLMRGHDPGWDCRGHFYAAASRAMRNILVEEARRKSRLKRGSGLRRSLDLDLQASAPGPEPDELIALDESLERLEVASPLNARIVMLRYFAGLSVQELASSLGIPRRRVERGWRFARAWLQRDMDANHE